jgi:putative solute:sodium symporter small subunit
VSEHPGRDRHRRRTLILVAATLLVALAGIPAAMGGADLLNRFAFLRFPLGFYLLAQGLLFALVAAAFWTSGLQEQIDRSYSESEEP